MRLVHAEAGARIVEARALEGDALLGSALGEGATAEEAEERARQRLQAQLQQPIQLPQPMPRPTRAPVPSAATPTAPARSAAPPTAPSPVQLAAAEPAATDPTAEHRAEHRAEMAISSSGPSNSQPHSSVTPAPPAPIPHEEPPGDPEDWSSELARIDLQLQRLGWQRPQESAYLERAFGHGSRSRITTYADLLAYLRTLETLEPGCDPDSVPVPLRRRDLLTQSDALLAQLGWSAGQGRQFLEQHLGLASRQQLSDPQLLQFNMLLEEAVLGSGSPELPPG